ncbi:unnamed protein product [Rhodiola kirilowii]
MVNENPYSSHYSTALRSHYFFPYSNRERSSFKLGEDDRADPKRIFWCALLQKLLDRFLIPSAVDSRLVIGKTERKIWPAERFI